MRNTTEDNKMAYAQAVLNSMKRRSDEYAFCSVIDLQEDLEARQHESRWTTKVIRAAAKRVHEKTVLGSGLQTLKNSKKIKRVAFDGRRLTICTKTLYCISEETGIEHEIGEMKIAIDCNLDCLSIENLTRTVYRQGFQMHTPHVFGERICFGPEFERVSSELFSRREYVALMFATIQFIETTRHGYYIERWPESRRSSKNKAKKNFF